MRLDIYQAETECLAREQSAMLDDAQLKLQAGRLLSPLEQGGILLALQRLIENAIGKAKHSLKAAREPVPVSAYDAFASLARIGVVPAEDLLQWNDVIGIRDRIVHDYMNIDMVVIFDLMRTARYHFVADYLMRPIGLPIAAYAQYQQELSLLEAELRELRGLLRLMEESRSWKITQPLRDALWWAESVRRNFRQALWLARSKGLGYVAGLVWKRLRTKILPRYPVRYYRNKLWRILAENPGKPIIVFRPVVDWNLPLFQRPQHVAKGLADQGFLYFFCTTNGFDAIHGFTKVHDGCYITDQFELVDQIEGKKIIHIYAADTQCKWEYIEGRLMVGDVVLYEYIDEIHADISGREISGELLERHTKVLRCENVICITSADKLYRDVERYRTKNTMLVTNGVDINHFTVDRNSTAIPPEIHDIVAKKKPIIGYFGALAKWFDYELILSLAKARPNYEILLIGWNYDQSINHYPIHDYPNITVIGPIDYQALPQYACWFNVSTIPFRINEVTESTSPIKLFEYMALGHPIVTTDMPECRKYRSALVAKSHEEFISLIDVAMQRCDNPDYLRTLVEEAKENSWECKARDIATILRKNLVGYESGQPDGARSGEECP